VRRASSAPGILNLRESPQFRPVTGLCAPAPSI
jgi:hypothetical protein